MSHIPGDIMAKSFKWIYAKVCLCRICPGVARRRASRKRRKIRALTMDRGSSEGDPDDDSYREEESETVTSESQTASVYSEEYSEGISGSSEESVEDTSTVTVPIMTCLFMMIG